MTYLELILLLDERGEKVIHDRAKSIQTDKFQYQRGPDGTWVQQELPPAPENPLTVLADTLPTVKGKKK